MIFVWTFVVLTNLNMTNIIPYNFIWLNYICYFKWGWIFNKIDKIIRFNFVSNWDSSITICYFMAFLFAKSASMFFPPFNPNLHWIYTDSASIFLFADLFDLIFCFIVTIYWFHRWANHIISKIQFIKWYITHFI